MVFTGYSGFLKQKQKNDRHDITEILFKVALNTINQTEQNYTWDRKKLSNVKYVYYGNTRFEPLDKTHQIQNSVAHTYVIQDAL